MDDLLSEFLTETSENLSVLDLELVKLEQNPNDPELLGNIFRLVHTIKGTCGFLGLPRLEAVAHAGENVLGKVRDGELEVTPEAVSLILECLDRIRSLTAALEASAAAGLPHIQVSPLQGKLLHLLARAQGARRVLEIGTLGGYSAIWLARALPPGGRLITLEADPKHAEVARGNVARAGLDHFANRMTCAATSTPPRARSSSDAAAALHAVNALAGNVVPRHEIIQYATRLGADVPFFAAGAPLALGWGRGERILRLPAPPAAPSPCCAAAATCCPRTSSTWRRKCCATA